MMLHDGEMEPREAEVVRLHAERCDRCSRRLAEFEHVGAVVRGDVVAPAPIPKPAWRPAWGPAPVLARVVPAVAAVVAIILGVVLTGVGEDPPDQVATDARSVEDVPLPTSTPPPPRADNPAGSPGPGPATDTSTPDVTPDPTSGSDDAAASTAPPPAVTVGVMVPGGLTGADEPIVRAVATSLAAANDSAGDGVRFELVVVDADDPEAPAAAVDRGVEVLVGGYAAHSTHYSALASRDIPWLAPAVVPPAPVRGVLSVELPHDDAGARIAEDLARSGHRRVAAVSRPGSPEERLVDGLRGSLAVASDVAVGTSCRGALQSAALSGADVLALALPRADVRRCLRALPPDFPIRQIAVPSTGVDAVEVAPDGFGIAAALGAPWPGGGGSGPARFREATGLSTGYRALVSFAGAEMLTDLLEGTTDEPDPLVAFSNGGVYRSDLLVLDPSAAPMNLAVQVVHLGDDTPNQTPDDEPGSAQSGLN